MIADAGDGRLGADDPARANGRRAETARWDVARGRVDPIRDDVLVAELGGTSIKLGCLRGGRVGAPSATCPSGAMRVADPAAALAALARRWCDGQGLSPALVVATVPGLLDADFDTVLRAANLPELEGRRFASELAERLGVPVVLERDAVLQLLGERAAGAARGEDHVLGIYVGPGIGAACLERGVPLRGAGWALEIGHRRARRDGAPAALGTDRGATESLEERASGVRLRAIAEREGCPIGALFARPEGPGEELLGIVDEHALAIGDCLAFLSPALVVVGGGLVEMPGYPWARLLATLEAQAPLPCVFGRTRVRRAALGWRAALHGALAEARAALGPCGRPENGA